MNRNYPAVARRARHQCEYCFAPEVVFHFPFEVDHIRPKIHGGSDEPDNLALGCRSCNLYKASHVDAFDSQSGQVVALFHPRLENWDRHFIFNSDGQIVGLTATGRVTIDLLKMNSPGQMTARQQWKRLRLSRS